MRNAPKWGAYCSI